MELSKRIGFLVLLLLQMLTTSFAQARVQLGDERLLNEYSEVLKGKRIGILAHYASRMGDGTHIVDALRKRPDFTLSMIFSPEHGFRSIDDTTVTDSIDPITNVQIYSLYGPRRAPTPEMLAQIDLILVDLQDVGLRYYTYPATVSYLLRAAKLAGKPVYLLDRPNPIGADLVEGSMLDASMANGGLTTIAQIPTRTGMTLGETANYLNLELKIGADLHVIAMSEYSRSLHWKDTGLPWIPSSPALVDPEQVELYAILGTLEALEVASGRGIDNAQAFRRYGAPYFTESKTRELINQLKLPGLSFTYTEWMPDRSKFMGQLCRGFQVQVIDPAQVQSLRSLIVVLQALQSAYGPQLQMPKALEMLGSAWLLDGVTNSKNVSELVIRAKDQLGPYLVKRKAAL
ncbi:MAG: DUF1343 domain-containing protein, partial [Bdellovibrionales bacterium]|nr:DUF1343 domain-containing protein [Oligoflexia bacterium]